MQEVYGFLDPTNLTFTETAKETIKNCKEYLLGRLRDEPRAIHLLPFDHL